MKKAYIPQKIRQKVFKRAKEMCEYCLSKGDLLGMDLEVEHIIPKSLGGASSLDNLCASCLIASLIASFLATQPSVCNRHKSSRIWVIDPDTGRRVRLFHPRQQQWDRHFRWSEDGTLIFGKTICGRATVEALQMNRERLVRARRLWAAWGEHPPQI